MSLESKSKIIGRYEYTVTQLAARNGRTAFLKMMKLAAPVIAAGVTATGNADKAVNATFQNVAQSITPEDFEWFVEVFAKSTTVKLGMDEQPQLSAIIDIHFAGKYFELCSWLAFCLEVNFGNFLEELGNTLGKEKPAASA